MTYDDDEYVESCPRELAKAAKEYSQSGPYGSGLLLVAAYKKKFAKIFDRARKMGLPEPDQLPHPSHVSYDSDKRMIVCTGPRTPQEKFRWENLKLQIRMNEAEIKRLAVSLRRNPNDKEKIDRFRQAQFVIAQLKRITPPGWNCHERLGWEKDRDWEFGLY